MTTTMTPYACPVDGGFVPSLRTLRVDGTRSLCSLRALRLRIYATADAALEESVRIHERNLRNSTTHTHGLAFQLPAPLICSQMSR